MIDLLVSRNESLRDNRWLGAAVLFALLTFLLTDEWLIGTSIFVLWVAWRFLPTLEGPPVLAGALTFQWLQVVAGIYYHSFTGRELTAIQLSDYRPMVLTGLACISVLVLGLTVGFRIAARKQSLGRSTRDLGLEWHDLAMAYAIFIVSAGAIQTLAWQIPALTQAILALNFLRYGLVFLMFRRLLHLRARWGWIILIVLIEVAIGLTGYFASFREPLMILGIALFEAFDYRKASNWIAFGSLAIVITLTGLVWTGIKVSYRAEFADAEFAASREARLARLASLVSDWFDHDVNGYLADLDKFVERMWPMYFPALAMSRVPDPIPHTDGELLRMAVMHVFTPRFLFPDKGIVRSDSDLVRLYSGIRVDDNTSMAFGYAAEAYVDFGLPWMFVPIAAYGFLMGAGVSWLLKKIQNKEMAIAIVTVIGWSSLYLFERSWIYMLGLAGTLMICLGGTGMLLDALLHRREETAPDGGADHGVVPMVCGNVVSR
jgi:hypothetical protein